MKKKYIILVLLVFIVQIFGSNFMYVDAKDDNDSQSICAGPSETMSLYFKFQNEMKRVLLESTINERRYSLSTKKGGLFTENVLELKTTPLDLVANSLLNRARSMISNATTSAVLVALASVSTLQSAAEGWAVLFRDRPIVRDYKTMMDIETDLFDVAYFRSKQVNMTLKLDGEMFEDLNTVIEEYQDLGLLAKKSDDVIQLNNSATMVDIIWDLLVMNATMKEFILFPAGLDLENYQGCMNKSRSNCNAVLKFDKKAIEQLKSDYKGTFGKCNSNFKSSMSKIGSSFLNDQKSGWQDVKDAMGRLKQALVAGWNWPWKKNRACDVSDYEMAQIRAYRGNDWTCGEAAKLYASIPDVKLKKSKGELRKRGTYLSKEERKEARENARKTKDRISTKKTTSEKKQEWSYIYGPGGEYNPEFSSKMDDDFSSIYDSIKEENDSANNNGEASDLSSELASINSLMEQIDAVEGQMSELEDSLKNIADYQCSG